LAEISVSDEHAASIFNDYLALPFGQISRARTQEGKGYLFVTNAFFSGPLKGPLFFFFPFFLFPSTFLPCA
jgi:hypothetical protein